MKQRRTTTISQTSIEKCNIERAKIGLDPIDLHAENKPNLSRLIIDMTYSMHSQIKIKAIERRQTIREYILELLRNDGVY